MSNGNKSKSPEEKISIQSSINDLLNLAVMKTAVIQLPEQLRSHWTALRRTRNVFKSISSLDLDLLTDRHAVLINYYISVMYEALTPLDLFLLDDTSVIDIDFAIHEFDTTHKIILGELVPLISHMQIYAGKS